MHRSKNGHIFLWARGAIYYVPMLFESLQEKMLKTALGGKIFAKKWL